VKPIAPRLSTLARRMGPWIAYGLTAIACAEYLESRAQLVPKRGEWYLAN